MKIIKEQIAIIKVVLPAQQVDSTKEYRRITFCLITEVDGQTLAYNSLTGEVVLLEAGEKAILQSESVLANDETKELIEKWFLVPADHDDIALSDEIVAFAKLFEKNDGIKTYTILTTLYCNARCFYCFEINRPKPVMSEKTAEDVVEYISKNAPSDKKIKIIWFGGEPLCNSKAIDIISSGVKNLGFELEAQIVSNGYLFDDELVKKAVEEWNINRVQITLDGTEPVYNKIKAYVGTTDESPFVVVTDNIERLMKNGIAVSVRMNLGVHNKEDVYKLTDWLAQRYQGYSNFGVYAHRLVDYEDESVAQSLRTALADALVELENHCMDLGILCKTYVQDGIRVNHCMADSSSDIVIVPDGRLGKCESCTDKELVGTIYDGITDFAKVEEFRARENCKEMCDGCVAYPNCVKLTKCFTWQKGKCDAAHRILEQAKLSHRVINTYRKTKKEG